MLRVTLAFASPLQAVAITLLLSLAACSGRTDTRMAGETGSARTPVLITHREDREANVGKTVTVEGEVSRTKLPQIAGVDVEIDESNDPRGKIARATGVLRKTVVTKEELDKAIAEHGMFANRGPGTFYHLEAPDGGGLAKAIILR